MTQFIRGKKKSWDVESKVTTKYVSLFSFLLKISLKNSQITYKISYYSILDSIKFRTTGLKWASAQSLPSESWRDPVTWPPCWWSRRCWRKRLHPADLRRGWWQTPARRWAGTGSAQPAGAALRSPPAEAHQEGFSSNCFFRNCAKQCRVAISYILHHILEQK